MSSAALAGGTRRKAAPAFRLKTYIAREHPLQAQIAKVLRIELAREAHISPHGVVWFSSDIAAYGGEVPGARVGRGVVAGAPDIWVLYLGYAYMIEVKADDGEMSSPQREMAIAAVSVGCRYGVARDSDDVLRMLDAWSIPRARRTHL